MNDPQPLGAGFAALADQFPPEHRLHRIAQEAARQSRQCQLRRAAVLKHPDLARRLTEFPLAYGSAPRWNGWIPPRITNPETRDDLLVSPAGRFNQRGKRTTSEELNNSPQRAALLELARDAWEREHPPAEPDAS